MNASSPPIRVACTGLEERDVFVVRSLLRIVDGRRQVSWRFHPDGEADILIARHTIAEELSREPERSKAGRLVWAFPDGTPAPEPAAKQGLALRYPFRAAELLELLDRLEGQWPFSPAAVSPDAPAPSNSASPGNGQSALPAVSPPASPIPPVPHPSSAPAIPAAPATPPVPATPVAAAPPPAVRPFPSATDDTAARNTATADAVATPAAAPLPWTTARESSLEQPPPPDRATTQMTLPHPSTIAALAAVLSGKGALPADGGKPRVVDIFGPRGWICRLMGGYPKAHVSSRFMLDRTSAPDPRAAFQWKPVLGGSPPLEAGDTLIEMDLDLFAWQFAHRFCRSFDRLGVPARSLLLLKRWPDFGVLPDFSTRPGILLAAALLTRSPISLTDAHQESGTDEADLACLLAACWLCGWLRCEKVRERVAVTEAMPEPRRAKAGGFSGVVRSLRKVLGLSRR